MVVVQAEYTAAQLAIDTDVFSLAPFSDHATAKRPRKVRRVGLSGANAAYEAEFELKYGARIVANKLYNLTTGLTLDDSHMFPICSSDYCHVDEPIMLTVTKIPTVSPVTIKVEIT